MTYPVQQIADILDAEALLRINQSVGHLIIDSRSVMPSGTSLFFAIKGENHNGHDYLDTVYEKGCRSFVLSERNSLFEKKSDVDILYVENTTQALHKLAAYHRSVMHAEILSVTGSNGKTVVKEWLWQLLAPDINISRSPRSYNSQVGVPLSLWLINPEDQLAIIEAGVSKPGEMSLLESMILPDTGIFTNIGEAHQENFSTREEKINEKIILFKNSAAIVFCYDHEMVRHAIKEQCVKSKLFSWSLSDPEADLFFRKTQSEPGSTTLELDHNGDVHEFMIPFEDQASVENALHVIAYAIFRGIEPWTIRERIKALQPVGMRMEMIKGAEGCTLINDAYNSDLYAINIAVDFLNAQRQNSKKTVILSDVLQSGKSSEEIYQQIAQLLHNSHIDRFIGVGPEMVRYASYFDVPDKFVYPSTDVLIDHLGKIRFHDELILIKGARVFQFERIIHELEEKKHRTELEISLNAITDNLNYFRSYLHPETKLLVMVKAFSYGAGSYEIASMLQHHHVDYLGVAFNDEGVELRNNGISLPVMVMNPGIDELDVMVNHQLEPEIYDLSFLIRLDQYLQNQGISDYPVHVKLDTGMRRMGFRVHEMEELTALINKCRHVVVKSVFSHLAASDEKEHDDFTLSQIYDFKKMTASLQAGIGYRFMRHILNSAGIERFSEYQFDMVRLGIGFYGITAVGAPEVRQISRLKSYISLIKDVLPEDTIGYGRKGILKKGGQIGVIPVGYADGLNRTLSNRKGELWVNGHWAPVVGNICMDMCMIDLTGIDAKVGDEVIIFGPEQPVSVLADQLNTIPYEILTSVSSRVKRVYLKE